MFKWGRSMKLNLFFDQLKQLESKVSIFTDECLDSCRGMGLEMDVLKADVDVVKKCIAFFEKRMCDAVPEYILDGGRARLIETYSLLESFSYRKILYATSKEKDVEKERLSEIMSSIHFSTRKLIVLKRAVEDGLEGESAARRFWRVIGGVLTVSGVVAEIVVWLIFYDGCLFVEYYWRLGSVLLIVVIGLILIWRTKRGDCFGATKMNCPYEPQSTEQKNLINALKRYCLSPNVDYAYMINGPWGVGKTYFINTVMRSALLDCGKELFYVSLNGVTSFNDIVKQIVLGQNCITRDEIKQSCVVPLCKKYIPEETIKFVFANWRDFFGVGRKDAGYLRSRLGDFLPDRSVIFVDDVERVEQAKTLKRLMAKLHEEFVCKGYHVVYSGAENEIKFLSEFNKVKEKYVRRTYLFPLDVFAIVDTFVASYPNGCKDYRHAKSCSNLLKDFACRLRVQNARTIKRILDDFLFLASQIGSEELLGKIRDVLFCRIAPIANELASGRLKPSDENAISELANIQGQRYAEEYERLFPGGSSQGEADKNSGKKSYVQGFLSRYEGKLSVPWNYDKCLVEYEIGGNLDVELLNKTVQGWLPAKSDKYSIALNTIWGHYSIEDGELTENYRIVEEGLGKGMYNAEHVNLACELLHNLNEMGYISVDCGKLIPIAVQALKDRWAQMPNDDINPLLLRERPDDFRKPIFEAIHAEQDRRDRKSTENDVMMFLSALSNKDREAAWQFFPRNTTWRIFDKIVKVDKCRDFCAVNNWALCLVSENLKDSAVFIHPSSRTSIEKIVQELSASIDGCDPNKNTLRKANLFKLKDGFKAVLDDPKFKQEEHESVSGVAGGAQVAGEGAAASLKDGRGGKEAVISAQEE